MKLCRARARRHDVSDSYIYQLDALELSLAPNDELTVFGSSLLFFLAPFTPKPGPLRTEYLPKLIYWVLHAEVPSAAAAALSLKRICLLRHKALSTSNSLAAPPRVAFASALLCKTCHPPHAPSKKFQTVLRSHITLTIPPTPTISVSFSCQLSKTLIACPDPAPASPKFRAWI
jgi:hypothetical protein